MMKFFFLLLVLFSSLYSKEKLEFGLFYERIFSSKEEARLGTNLWLKQMKEVHLDFDIDVIFYEDKERIIEDFKNKKLTTIIVNSMFYYDNKTIIDELSLDRWIVSRNDNKFEQFYLIKNKNLKFNFNTLKSKNILYKEEAGKNWLETLLYKKKINANTSLKNSQKTRKGKKLIFDVFFDTNSVSVVGKDLYDSMVEINPQVKEKVEIVAKSKPIFVRGIGFTRDGINSKKVEVLYKITDRINKSETNFEVLSFIQVQNIFIVNGNELDELAKFYGEYKKLKENR